MKKFISKRLDTQSKTLFKNSSWVFFANIFGVILTFLRAIVIARGLGAELFGIYTVIVAFITTVMEVLNLNLATAIIRFGAKFKAENRPDKLVALIKISVLATLGIAVASVTVISILTFTTYDTFIKAPGLSWFSITYTFAASALLFNQISRGVLRLYFKFKVNSVIQMIMDVIELSLITSALFIWPKELHYFLIAILFSRFINGAIPAIAAFRELLPELREHTKAKISIISTQFKEIRVFVITNSFSRTIQSLINNGDVLLIGILASSPTQAAYYAVGKKLAFSILTLTDPLSNSIFPQLCKLHAEKQFKSIRMMLLKLTAMAAIPATIFMLVAIFFNQWIIKTAFGEEYLEAGTTFYLLTGASLIYAMFFWIQPLLQAIDLVYLRLKVSIIGFITGLTTAYFLIPKYGSDGMAFTMILMNVIMPGFFIYYALKKLDSDEHKMGTANIPDTENSLNH
jgi:O-antigen/teichoic acid export membrane protein